MASLKEVRNRITSVSSTQQITSAMKMVSAAKLRRAQDAITQLRPYSIKLQDILQNLTASVDVSVAGAFAENRSPEKVLFIAVSSNRGLAGAFNSNIAKTIRLAIKNDYADQAAKGQVSIVSIGKKAGDYFVRNGYKVVSQNNHIYEKLTFDNVAAVAEKVMEDYKNGAYDRVLIVYNHFRNPAVQIPTIEQMLPVLPPVKDEKKASNNAIPYIYEPDQATIVKEIIPKSLKIQLFKAVLDSHASEHGARMTAMNKATDNAKELLRDLKLSYNKARQAAITNEILEIVGGAEALND